MKRADARKVYYGIEFVASMPLVFAYNVVFQLLQIGRWRDYLHGERAYMLPSLIAETLLAWQVWSGTVRPWKRPVQSRSMTTTTATARIHDRQLPA